MQLSEQATNLLNLIPETGSIGNVTLRRKLLGPVELSDDPSYPVIFSNAKSELLAAGLIKLGRGKGGSVKRVDLNQSVNAVHDLVTSVAFPEPSSVTEQDAEPVDATTEFGGGYVFAEISRDSVPDSTGVSIDGPSEEF